MLKAFSYKSPLGRARTTTETRQPPAEEANRLQLEPNRYFDADLCLLACVLALTRSPFLRTAYFDHRLSVGSPSYTLGACYTAVQYFFKYTTFTADSQPAISGNANNLFSLKHSF